MILGQITGKVVSTQKDPGLSGVKMLIVQDLDLDSMKPTNKYVIAIDTVGAGVGEFVITVAGSSARIAEGMKEVPVDCAIVGIVDTINMEGRVAYSKREPAAV